MLWNYPLSPTSIFDKVHLSRKPTEPGKGTPATQHRGRQDLRAGSSMLGTPFDSCYLTGNETSCDHGHGDICVLVLSCLLFPTGHVPAQSIMVTPLRRHPGNIQWKCTLDVQISDIVTDVGRPLPALSSLAVMTGSVCAHGPLLDSGTHTRASPLRPPQAPHELVWFRKGCPQGLGLSTPVAAFNRPRTVAGG